MSTPQAGTLYLVGTPIGNLEDITLRALSILRQVDAIAAEDTRHTGKLLHHFQIDKPQLSYHDHNRHSRLPDLLHRLQQGQTIALVTDAGMPGISDPGYELVQACVEAGVPVVPIPGVTAAITALCASGLPTERFVFEGFLPAKASARRDRLAQLQSEARTLVFYEAPHRVRATLQDLSDLWGSDRAIVLARELTKRYEQFWRGTIGEAVQHYQTQEPQGEFTIVVAGRAASAIVLTDAALCQELRQLLSQGLSRSAASRQLAQQTALPKRQIYQLALTLPDPEPIAEPLHPDSIEP